MEGLFSVETTYFADVILPVPIPRMFTYRVPRNFVDEIKIVDPKVCLFFTGPDFDTRIKKIFEGIEFKAIEDWNVKQFCRLKHPLLPKDSYRSYHPKSLRLRHLEDNFLQFLTNVA